MHLRSNGRHIAGWINRFYPKHRGLVTLLGGLLLPLFFQSCNNTKFLAEDEKLYTYGWFSEEGFGKINNKPLKAYELYLVGNAKTNRPFILLPRTSLTLYNYCKTDKEKGFKHYMHKWFGKPPVLLEQVNPDFRTKVMKQRLTQMGHFDSDVTYDVKVYGKYDKKARVRYNIYFRTAYTYRDLEFYSKNKNRATDSIIASNMKASLLEPGNDYWVKDLKEERTRLSELLQNQGYYFFNPDYLLFHADTTVGEKQVDMTLVIKDDISEKAFHSYTLRNVDVLVKSNRKNQQSLRPRDPVFVNDVYYTSIGDPFRPKVITRPISLQPGQTYTYTDHENTLRYMQGMQAFRSVSVRFSEVDSTSDRLDAMIELTPRKPVVTSLEVNFATKSNDFLGPSAIASIGHGNIFKGAEQLTFQLDGGFEWQRSSRRQEYQLGFNSYEIGAQLKLTLPRFLLPFGVPGQSRRYVPKTYASIGLRRLKRVKYYGMNLSQVKFGYNWRTSPKREYKIDPVSIDYLRLTETSADFDKFLADYPQVALSFEEQFIIGTTASYIYTTNPKRRKLNQFYYNGTIDVAGNLVDRLYRLAGPVKQDSAGPNELLGSPYAQYAKVTNDLRYYYFISEKTQIAARLLAGIGVPYGNSEVLPYVKQYFAGGSQDIRAFYARSLGPGSYSPPDSVLQRGFLDQSGEIKLMGSIEYRFPITYNVYGAVFVDAGNVWLLKEDASRPGGRFEFNSFLDDIAVGSGVGIRVDIEYFVIRLDMGIPVRKPYLDAAEEWIFGNTSFFGDYILSLAVGYPF